jgi:hypothetical protein
MTLRKSILVALILIVAFALWAPRQWQLNRTRRAVSDINAQSASLEQQIAAIASDLESVQHELTAEKLRRNQALAEVATASSSLAKVNPESRWATPPANLPEWNPDSPFIWLRKEVLPEFPVSPFLASGELRPEVSYVLTVSPAQQRTLNAALSQCLRRYREIETSKVERLEEHLPGIADRPGAKATIRVPPLPDEGARAKEEFAAALTGSLGEQRAELLLKLGDSWLDEQLSQSGKEPKTISVLRRPDGSGNVSIKAGGSWMSVGLDKGHPEMLWEYVPKHLASFFTEVLSETGNPASANVPQ